LLRFSVTLEAADRLAVMAMADEMDRLGFVIEKPEFSFFLRTSIDVCSAVADREKADRNDVLRPHLARVDDPRLRRAFLAVFEIDAQEGASGRQARPGILFRSVEGKMRR
jgi:hypothetical protein